MFFSWGGSFVGVSFSKLALFKFACLTGKRSGVRHHAFRLFGGGMSGISNAFPRSKSPTHLIGGGAREGHLKQCLFRRPAAIPARQTTARLFIIESTYKYSENLGLFHGFFTYRWDGYLSSCYNPLAAQSSPNSNPFALSPAP